MKHHAISIPDHLLARAIQHLVEYDEDLKERDPHNLSGLAQKMRREIQGVVAELETIRNAAITNSRGAAGARGRHTVMLERHAG